MVAVEREKARVVACLKAKLDLGAKADAAVEEAAKKTVDNIVVVFIWCYQHNVISSSFLVALVGLLVVRLYLTDFIVTPSFIHH
jgi:hypothetical protein